MLITHISSCQPPTRTHASLSWCTCTTGLLRTTSCWSVRRVKHLCSVWEECGEVPCNFHHWARWAAELSVSSLRILGVVVNDRMTAADHVSHLLTACSRQLYALWHYESCEHTEHLASHSATSPKPHWFPGWPTVRQPGRAFALPLTEHSCTLYWGAVDVSGAWKTLTLSLLTNYSSLLTINCLRKLYSTQLMFFCPWFRTAHCHLMISDLAPITNICLIKLHISTIVNLSFTCSILSITTYYVHKLSHTAIYSLFCHKLHLSAFL